MNKGLLAVQRGRSTLAGLFLLTMAVVMMELCLTRSLSVVSWQDFVYLMISLALLGFGAAGSFLTVSRRFSGSAQEQTSQLGYFAWLFSLSAALAIVLVSKIRFYPEDIVGMHDYSNGISLLILYFILGVPFFFAGVCIGRLVAMAGDQVNLYYFVDLAGAGVGDFGERGFHPSTSTDVRISSRGTSADQ